MYLWNVITKTEIFVIGHKLSKNHRIHNLYFFNPQSNFNKIVNVKILTDIFSDDVQKEISLKVVKFCFQIVMFRCTIQRYIYQENGSNLHIFEPCKGQTSIHLGLSPSYHPGIYRRHWRRQWRRHRISPRRTDGSPPRMAPDRDRLWSAPSACYSDRLRPYTGQRGTSTCSDYRHSPPPPAYLNE